MRYYSEEERAELRAKLHDLTLSRAIFLAFALFPLYSLKIGLKAYDFIKRKL